MQFQSHIRALFALRVSLFLATASSYLTACSVQNDTASPPDESTDSTQSESGDSPIGISALPEDSSCCRVSDPSDPTFRAGCDDAGVEQCVCRILPGCCLEVWGPDCVLEAALTCGTCLEVDPAVIALLPTDSDGDGLSDGAEIVMGQDPFDPSDGASDPRDDQFFGSCVATPAAELPSSSYDCSGPDADGWSNQVGRDGLGPCPAPPEGPCTQVVFGRLDDTAEYINCPGYIVLSRSDWTIHLNDEFIACTAACELGTCDPPVLVVSGHEDVPEFSLDIPLTTVTSRELCQLHNSGCTVVFADENGPGYVDCDCWSR